MSVENDLPNEELHNEEEMNEAQAAAENPQETPQENAQQDEQLVDEYKDKFVRLYAEFDNYRRRTNEEKLQLMATAGKDVISTMLPVLDNFERAIATNENLDDITAIKEGFQLIYNMLKANLEAKGLKPMESKGQGFDSDLHEAIANIPAPDAALKGKVIDDVEKGYFLNDKVLRFAKVVVGQ
ncbi:MAG: nucleotide exchange factor GrpE [Crocinitomicaceae bacterium]|nr:nucleotide exchange factor GrpE [Crocinitomicaceae bacterium]MDP4798910.1 nucleotide exchange factor GrpE [Crocinitomicaceae bacterium]MDP5042804.1 nucleotide exchange factor GrpE [Crocinitomicaceae bacterium]